MANEITILSDLAVKKGGVNYQLPLNRQSVTQTGTRLKDVVINVGTSEVSLAINDVGTPGYVVLRNLDGTNYVQWGIATTVYTGRMLAGESANPFRIDAGVTTLYLKANTAACDVRVVVLEA